MAEGEKVSRRETGGAERVPLRDEAAARVHCDAAARAQLRRLRELSAPPGFAEPQRVVRDQLVGRETVVQLADLEVFRPESRSRIQSVCCAARHFEADEVHRAARIESARQVRVHLHSENADRAVLQAALENKVLRGEKRRRAAVRRRAAQTQSKLFE